jgi:helicase required for RNAi-mediated heterochromatin assembly 1
MISGENQKATSILTDHVKKPYQSREFAEPWRNLPEVPTKEEIMPATDEDSGGDQEPEQWNDYQQDPVYDPNLPHNIVDGPWPSKERYISAHYRILREDAIAGLRHSVASVKRRPAMMDDKETCIYTHVTLLGQHIVNIELMKVQVTFKGLLLARIGPAFRVEFSHERSEKQIRWEQSKRLIPGTIVALTPHRDMFRKICKIAVVAARSIEGGLDQNPPQIDLFWGSPDDAVFDPVERKLSL